MTTISATAVHGIPEITPGVDLASAIVDSLTNETPPRALTDTDIVVIAHKVISKSEGRVYDLANVVPGPEAVTLAQTVHKDPRLVQLILDESVEVLRAVPGVLIVETHHGFVCANAGADASNVGGGERVLLLPRDPDRSARELRAEIRKLTGASPAVLITDSFGRAWRSGQVDFAIGCAGLAPIQDWRGSSDIFGREMKATMIAVADSLAATADLARSKDSAEPVVIISGAGAHILTGDGPGVAPLLRERHHDLFR